MDQRAENFSVGATLMMRWHDPALAYSPDSDPCRCRFKTLKESNFDQLIMEKGRKWPEFTIYNQQGNRFSQNRLFGIFPDGDVLYFERFTTTLQAPDFNFRRYPFDRQQFFIHVDSVYPKDFYVFTDLEGFSEVGARLGQEEWKVQRFDTLVSSVTASTRGATSRFSFRVVGQHRHDRRLDATNKFRKRRLLRGNVGLAGRIRIRAILSVDNLSENEKRQNEGSKQQRRFFHRGVSGGVFYIDVLSIARIIFPR